MLRSANKKVWGIRSRHLEAEKAIDVEKRLGQYVRYGLFLLAMTVLATLPPLQAKSAPYAAMVIDARTGEVLHSRNADTRLHPASLTKMMTLYVAFEAIENGEISLDSTVTISRKAANEPPSRLGLRAGQKIKLRYLVRAAAVKSANDAATAIAEAISGSEAAFARRMNRTAKSLGMSRTTFKNAHGLTEKGHLSTARDMTTMGRRLFYDYPKYYNLFSRITADAGVRKVSHTNTRFLNSYRGADGIKTGYTRAAGFNLVASAERGQERIIVTVFGGRSTSGRNAKVAELMDLGFRRAPSQARVQKPKMPLYAGAGASKPTKPNANPAAAGKTIRLVGAVGKSIRPAPRPDLTPVAPPEAMLLAMKTEIDQVLAQVQAAEPAKPIPAPTSGTETTSFATATNRAPETAPRPQPHPSRAEPAQMAVATVAADLPGQKPIVVTRISTSGGRLWGINIGKYNSRYQAERVLLKTALNELGTLDEALRKVVRRGGGFDANFVGMSQEMAALACRRLSARNLECSTLGPS